MKKYNIQERVFKVNLKYSRLQNKTEELFFKCLAEERSVEYFKKKLYKLWKNTNTDYLEEQVEEYVKMIHEENIKGKKIEEVETEEEEGSVIFALIPFINVDKQKNKFLNDKTREYKRSYESPVYKEDKSAYMEMKLGKYSNDTVPYYSHKTNKIIRYIPPSVYNSMVFNTNLVRSTWNETIKDAEMLGVNYFTIPYHNFSCPHCIAHQEKLLSMADVISLTGSADEASGDILHPNCKCDLVMWDRDKPIPKSNLSDQEKDEIYQTRQKVNSLTLKKERLKTEMNIAEKNGFTKTYDKLNSQRNKINNELKKITETIPNKELKNQLTSIFRFDQRANSSLYDKLKQQELKLTQQEILKERKKQEQYAKELRAKAREQQKIEKEKALKREIRQRGWQTHKEMQKVWDARENRTKYLEKLERKQKQLKETKKIIKENGNLMYYDIQQKSLEKEIKEIKDLLKK